MQVLNATNKRKNYTHRDLYNLMYDSHNIDNTGTISYRDNWQMFDQIIVSFSLLVNDGAYYTGFGEGKVHDLPLLICSLPIRKQEPGVPTGHMEETLITEGSAITCRST
jgi:hypothetical protein